MSASERQVFCSIEEYYDNIELRMPPEWLEVGEQYIVIAALKSYLGREQAAKIPVSISELHNDPSLENMHFARVQVPDTARRSRFNAVASILDGFWLDAHQALKFSRSRIIGAYFMGEETDWDGGLSELTKALDTPTEKFILPLPV